jgi:hypothetical protein
MPPVGSGQIHEEPGKETQVKTEHAVWDQEQEGDRGTDHRGHGVCREERDGAATVVLVQGGDRVGVETISEVVGDDRDGDHDADAAAGLERSADSESIHHAVPHQT